MSNEHERLRQLLFQQELEQLEAIRRLLASDDELSERIAQLLDQASDLTIKQNPEFIDKFISRSPAPYLKALKRNPKGIISLLTPVISPVIRQSVTQAMRRFIVEINRTLELGFSIKSLKWRWQAMRAGVPFSEVVFANTVQYQVQQLFLIDKDSGLLIQHVGQEHMLREDQEAISAMLTAIQEFIKDSLQTDDETLSSAEMGESVLWVLPGSQANLAAVIKGSPSGKLRQALANFLSEVHLNHQSVLLKQEQWNKSPELQLDMENHLLQKSIREDRPAKVWPWLLVISLLIGYALFRSYQNYSSRHELEQQLAKIPGLVVENIKKDGDGYVVKGLKDPLLNLDQHLDKSAKISFSTQKYYALDDVFVEQRVRNFLQPSPVKVTVNNGTVTLSGTAETNLEQQAQLLKLLPGVLKVINQVRPKLEEAVEVFSKNHSLPKGLSLQVKQQQLIISGKLSQSQWQELEPKLKQKFGQFVQNFEWIDEKEHLLQQVTEQPLLISNSRQLSQENFSQLSKILKANQTLDAFYQPTTLILRAKSDCQGSIAISDKNSQRRLSLVEAYVLKSGMRPEKIKTVLEKCQRLSPVVNPKKNGIWFEKEV